jgi:Tfp pilus assembly protein PilO
MRFRSREMIFFVLMLALLGGTYFFVFSKTNAKRQAYLADTALKQKKINDLNAATVGIDDMSAKIEQLSKAITFFQQKLPPEKDMDGILQEVWELAKTNSLDSKAVKPDKNDHGPNYSEQSIQMTLSGNFNGFYSFMLELEKLPRITRVTQMKLTKLNEKDGEATAQITLSIFFEPTAANASVASIN